MPPKLPIKFRVPENSKPCNSNHEWALNICIEFGGLKLTLFVISGALLGSLIAPEIAPINAPK